MTRNQFKSLTVMLVLSAGHITSIEPLSAQQSGSPDSQAKEYVQYLLTSFNSPGKESREKQRRTRMAILHLDFSLKEMDSFVQETNRSASDLDALKVKLDSLNSQRASGVQSEAQFAQGVRNLAGQRAQLVADAANRLWIRLEPKSRKIISSLSATGRTSKSETVR